MSVRVASPATAGEKAMAPTAWPYLEYMAQWERQVERRQLFLRSYHFSRDAEVSPRARTRRVVWAGARRLRRAAAKGLRRLRARIRLCFGWAAPALRRRSSPRRGGVHGFRYGRLPRGKAPPAAANAASVCFW
ncbi:hypothetical protein CFC21_080645 [Triticum aestivum]|uniref:Uncharacterized protein n=3 Tax=Triticinae TaxID=1648030 RepID=A0A9R1I220_WHEAT|nr:uncharacterized protein LOC109751743 [Aegilops tauschii subsp. strangulata]XP_044402393.1 uncharacterized protein LOC123126043 [Triticum aestivum]KAF7075914.1 hypothetical protein CFC21_080645 [Triticum aestivum]